MPSYEYECKDCGASETVLVRMSESGTLPPPGTGDCKHTWVRVFLGAPTVVRGPNWGGGKGHWLLPLVLLPTFSSCVTALDFSPPHQLIKRDRCGESPVVDFRTLTAEHDYFTVGCR